MYKQLWDLFGSYVYILHNNGMKQLLEPRMDFEQQYQFKTMHLGFRFNRFIMSKRAGSWGVSLQISIGFNTTYMVEDSVLAFIMSVFLLGEIFYKCNIESYSLLNGFPT